MKLFRHILLSALLLFSSIGYAQNNLISNGTNIIKVGNNLLYSSSAFINVYSLLFDGVDEYIDCGTDASLSPINSITVSAWVKVSSYDDFTMIAGRVTNDAWAAGYGLYLGNGAIRFWINNYATNVATKSYTADGSWHHFAGTYDNSLGSNQMKVYIDGIKGTDKTFDIVITNGNNGLLLGFGEGGAHLNGNIDEVSIWNTNLSLEQIEEIYNSGKPTDLLKHSESGNLVSYFRMGDKSTFSGGNFTLPDQKGSNDGTSVNMEEADRKADIPLP